MEDIEGLWKSFSLNDQEDDKFDLSSMAHQVKPTLAAKFFTRRTINVEAVARTFKPLWQTKQSFSLQDVGENIVLIEFDDGSDLERVFLGEPWSYDKYLIAFHRVGAGIAIEELPFNRVDFWVQLHNLPILCMKKSVAETMGKSIGEVLRAQTHEEEAGNGRCMRIRVRVDISKPLRRGHRIGLAHGGEGWVSFQYERLPNFCYWCGIPTHGEKDCEDWLNSTEAEKDKAPEYGVWLRASQDRVTRRVQVTVEGRTRGAGNTTGRKMPGPTTTRTSWRAESEQPPSTESDPTDMETTENMAEDNCIADISAKKSVTFEDQLREIDLALNFTPLIPEIIGIAGKEKSIRNEEWMGLGSPTQTTSKAPNSPMGLRSPLGDITNDCSPLTHKPKAGTWKKKARAKGQGSSDLRIFTVAEKRTSDAAFQLEDGEPRWTVQELASMVRVKAPSAVFLTETWSNDDYLEKIRCLLHFSSKLVVHSHNKGGGLVLFWNDEFNLTIKSYSPCHIDAIIREGSANAWRLTGVYGAPETHRRDETWALLRHLNTMFHLPWCCIGDFNEIVKLEEMKGRIPRSDRQMRGFRSALDDCGLMDLRFRGFPYTWCNNRDPPATTWVRLDRAVATIDWLQRFPMSMVEHIDVAKSDHKCIWLDCSPRMIARPKRRPFRFEEAWMADGRCEEVIKQAWEVSQPGTRMFTASQRRRRNYISRLSDERGRWHDSNEEIADLMVEYYNTLFCTSNPTSLNEAVANVPKVVTVDMNNNLIRDFRAEEVEQAIKQMAPSKAPGPDGRLITDNVLVAFETLHHMHNNKLGREGAMALKLDMSKAYDRVEWRYLEPHGNIHPSRGLRQGDPLSPYLFLLCAEGLHSLIKKAESSGDIQGVSLCRGGPKITHLFFADDSLLFIKATTTACDQIQSILGQYERASGQQVNRDKTTIFFSRSIPIPNQNAIKDILNVPIIRQYEKYLGLPSLIGRNKAESFTQIKERVWHKLKGWKEKLLSQAGREVLIKAVAQAIPAYSMSCFRLPIKLCRDLEAYDSKILVEVFKAKFFPHCSILDTDSKTRGSYAWQSILKAREVILKGGVWRVGNGKSINIWKHRWLLEDNHRNIISHGPQLLKDCTVDQLIIQPQMEWDHDLLDKIFLPYDAEAIKNIPLSHRAPQDKFCWPGTTHGGYTVKSGYQLLIHLEKQQLPGCSSNDNLQHLWKAVWSLKIPKKCQTFAWRASREALPTRVNLMKRRIPLDPLCENCRNSQEDVLHAVWACPLIQPAWENEAWTLSLRSSQLLDYADLFSKVIESGSSKDAEVFTVITWALWRRRNKLRLHQAVEAIEQFLPPARIIKWQPPRHNLFKANYDGAVFKETNEAGLGVIIRDRAGRVMASLVQKVRYPQSVESIEAWAAKRAVQFGD
uniref:Reverse transcriptase domain-containing protein n=1 Tax=Fagus sylvatica TaxID=28930 RepID=A0A2N9I5D1_FAGSY